MAEDLWSPEEADDPVARAAEIDEANRLCAEFLAMVAGGRVEEGRSWANDLDWATGVLWLCAGLADDGTVPTILRVLDRKGIVYSRIAELLPPFLKRANRLIEQRRPEFERRAAWRLNPPSDDDIPF